MLRFLGKYCLDYNPFSGKILVGVYMKIMGDVTKRDLKDIRCGRCKKSCKIEIGAGHYNLSYATLEARWPYGSPKDTEHHQLHFCEPCYDWVRELLKANGIEVDVAEGDAWQGKSLLDIGENEDARNSNDSNQLA